MEPSRNPIRLLLRIPVPWVFVLGYLIGVAVERAWPLHIVERLPFGGVTGSVVLGIGCAIAGWSLANFWQAHTTTVPGETSSQMVTWGPYRFTRNPMYLGLTIAYVGEALLLRQFWPVVFLPLVIAYVNWIVIPLEESKLQEAFGERYDQYRTRVRRWV
ncbi:MAG TPA: isoprenylcysteine carboxylmethyltransferase family protein [Lacipirellulaceae bacterium]|jgi:protein-S-isoprenylcysteine O-methyltransferase Ste14|nr:isoprenylcysteine carboxylmethyltransferase family protein [Lacipirellulaceae bacterium]